MNEKTFLITLDTEEDNQWNPNQPPTTENSKYLPRFQELCEKYRLKPTWLTTYKMASDPFFVEYFREKQDKGLCEIGMHLHAWNTPPNFELNKITNERSYLIEYPEDIMDAKIANITELLINNFGKAPVSHRAGRWAINDKYFKLLAKYGFKIDCSVTPGINWQKSLGTTGLVGTDYTEFPHEPYFINDKILELPVTIEKLRFVDFNHIHSLKNVLGEIYRFCKGRMQWLRPGKNANIRSLDKVLKYVANNPKRDYAMFMIHSSELMSGGSPSFQTEDDIENLYVCIEELFLQASKSFIGKSLEDYYEEK